MSSFAAHSRRVAWAGVALSALVAACDRSPDSVAPPNPAAPTMALEVSSASAVAGEQVALAIRIESPTRIGGVQGFIHFNSASLRYRGQVTMNGALLAVNASRAAEGQLRIGAVDADGLGNRVGTFVFDVIAGNYVSSLSFATEVAAGMRGERFTQFKASHGAIVSNLLVPQNAKLMSARDLFASIVASDADLAARFTPGQIVPGLLFGNADLSPDIVGPPPIPQITINDALVTVLASVGAQELILGTDTPDPANSSPGKDMVLAANVFPENAPGLGEPGDALPPGWVSATDQGLIDISDALEVVLASVGVVRPVAGHVMPGRPATAPTDPSCPTGRTIVAANITTNTTFVRGCVYELRGGVQVTGGATLTIQPGVRVEGQTSTTPGTGGAALFVQRDGKLIADGTELQPIVFTCTGTKAKGCWGGLVINGNATLNEGTMTSPIVPGRAATGGCFEKTGEGSSGLYGGCNPDDNSGVLRYVRVEYGGFRFTETNELNNIALQGVGRGTIVDNVQAHGGQDDGIEFFGGTVNAKHLYLTANSDDSMDWVEGWSGKVQFVVVQHDPLDSDKGFEGDNTNTSFDAQPRAVPQIYNVTLVGKPDPTSTAGTPNNNSVGAMHIRRGTRPTIRNAIVQSFAWALNIDDAPTCVSDAQGSFTIQNAIYVLNARLDAPDTPDPTCAGATNEDGFLHAMANNTFPAASPMLAPLNVLLPDFRPAFGLANGGIAPPNDGFFVDPIITGTASRYQGAVEPANSSKSNRPWYAGWTRGWQTATAP